MEIFKIENLYFSYPNTDEYALENISLTINKGEFLTVCGKSGCGKTTLLRNLKPTLTPSGETRGIVFFEGVDINNLSREAECRKIGFVQQNPENMIVTDTVWHELAFGLENMGMSSAEIRVRVAEIATFFDLQGVFNKKVCELSGGQKQLLNLASVMVMNPSVLILDEPTSQLDPIAAQEFLNALKRVNSELGVTVIISEHRTEEVFAVSSSVVFMDKGRAVEKVSIRELDKVTDRISFAEFMLPTAVRIFRSVSGEGVCPVTVTEGKLWLNEWAQSKPVKNVIQKETQNKKENSVISFQEIFFKYDNALPDVLKGISGEIYSGEVLGIVGGNGVGKSTLLSVISGIKKPYRGRVKTKEGCLIGYLFQNPQTIFAEKTIRQDLMGVFEETGLTIDEKAESVQSVAELCEISSILDRHPYDVSGGELQRAALAKILLLDPSVILMDEPTKGMDVIFKRKFGRIIRKLKEMGKSILLVSHDIEFCAEYTDRCSMLFDGSLVRTSDTQEFFKGNMFFTTAANRIARDVLPDIVLTEEIIQSLGGKVYAEKEEDGLGAFVKKEEPPAIEEKKKKFNVWKLILGIVFCIAYYFCKTQNETTFGTWRGSASQILSIIFAFLGIACFIPSRLMKKELPVATVEKNRKKMSVRSFAAGMVSIVLVPLTVLFGMYVLDDKKYFLISILIILEIMFPFFAWFEGRKPSAAEIVTISVLCALGVSGRVALAMFPQFKPMLAIVIITSVCFGGESGFLVGAISAFVSNFYFGQGPWTPWQMLALGMVGFVAGLVFETGFIKRSRLAICLFGGISTIVIYGGILNLTSVFMMQQSFTLKNAIAFCIAGLPFDSVYAVATMGFLWFGAVPMIEKLERIKQKYGIMK